MRVVKPAQVLSLFGQQMSGVDELEIERIRMVGWGKKTVGLAQMVEGRIPVGVGGIPVGVGRDGLES